MKKSFKIISALILSSTMAFGLGATVFASSRNVKKTEAYYSPSTHYEVSDTTSELASYYSSISSSDSGTSLLSKLQSLNSTKRKKTVGYSSMGTGTDGAFIYTDYDLNNTATDSNGQKYGTKVASFYTKTSTTSWNREHTWPKSHGGNLIDDDIHMTRPTITSENSDRGNSFYVEGKNSSSAGWDPYTAGYSKEMRGECARIILYGVVANSSLSLVASDSHSTSNANPDNLMGNMHTLIKWHFDYSPNVYEMNRNNGGEYLQGNRNPFIDHPEYVAKIWSSFDSTVSSLCSQNASMYSNWTPGSYSSYGTNDAAGGSTSTDPAISIYAQSSSVKVGKTITLQANKSNITGTVQWYVADYSSDVVSLSATSGDSITVTGVSEGTKTIYAHIGTVSANVSITVTAASTNTGGKVTDTSDLSTGDKVVVRTEQDTPNGVTGFNGSKDATVSTTESSWKEFTVKDATSNGFKLYDDTAAQYIASPSGNEFKYSTSGGVCSVDADGHLICNSRYLCANGTNYRFYTAVGSYIPFFVYKVGGSTTTKTLSSIAVSNATTTYTVGDTFVKPTVTATFSDNSTADVTNATTFSGYNMSATGTQEVTASYTYDGVTKTAKYNITINAQTGDASTVTINFADGGNCTSTSGSFTNLEFTSEQSSGSNPPAYNTNSHELRLYIGTNGAGNTVTLTPASGKTITKVVLTASSTSYTPTVKYNVDGGSDAQGTWSDTTMSISGISASSSFVFRNANATNTQLRLKSIAVTMTGGSTTTKTLSSIAVSNATTTYTVGDTFVKPTVTATYSDTTTANVTSSATFSGYNMSTAGTYTVNVSYTEGSVTKTTSYTITVNAASSTAKTYQVVTSASDLSAGDKVVIVGSNNSNYYYMTNEAKANYPWYIVGTAITPSNNQITGDNLTEWTVSKSGNYFSFTNNSVDLYGYVDGTHYSLNLGTTYTKSGSTTNVVTSFSAVKTWTYTITDSSTGAATLYANSSANVYLEYYSSSFCGYKNAPTSGSIFLFKEVTTTTNPALEFAQNFLSAFTCDATGTNAPTFASGKSWASLKTAFNALNTTDQNTLKNATAKESGTDIEKAVARYDYVVAKYSYEDFMNRDPGNGSNRMNVFGGHTTNYILLILGSVSLLGGLTYLAYFLKKRKED